MLCSTSLIVEKARIIKKLSTSELLINEEQQQGGSDSAMEGYICLIPSGVSLWRLKTVSINQDSLLICHGVYGARTTRPLLSNKASSRDWLLLPMLHHPHLSRYIVLCVYQDAIARKSCKGLDINELNSIVDEVVQFGFGDFDWNRQTKWIWIHHWCR